MDEVHGVGKLCQGFPSGSSRTRPIIPRWPRNDGQHSSDSATAHAGFVSATYE